MSNSDDQRLLGVDMPAGPRGGPVFDGAGRLVGVATRMSSSQNADQLLSAVTLQKALGKAVAPAMPAGTPPAASADKIYENSLKSSLQVIAVPR